MWIREFDWLYYRFPSAYRKQLRILLLFRAFLVSVLYNLISQALLIYTLLISILFSYSLLVILLSVFRHEPRCSEDLATNSQVIDFKAQNCLNTLSSYCSIHGCWVLTRTKVKIFQKRAKNIYRIEFLYRQQAGWNCLFKGQFFIGSWLSERKGPSRLFQSFSHRE